MFSIISDTAGFSRFFPALSKPVVAVWLIVGLPVRKAPARRGFAAQYGFLRPDVQPLIYHHVASRKSSPLISPTMASKTSPPYVDTKQLISYDYAPKIGFLSMQKPY